MTDTIHPTVDSFLRQYEAAERLDGADAAHQPEAATRLQGWVQAHPAAALRLVQEAQAAQDQLQAARRAREREVRAQRMGVKAAPSQDELKRQSQAWDRLLGTRNGHRAQAPGGGGAPAAARRLTFEDIGARFMAEHAGKAWLALALVAAVVVALR